MAVNGQLNKRYAVFIPCFNAASTIQQTLASVHEAVEFTGSHLPVYVYDDCSTDRSMDIVSKAQEIYKEIHVVRNEKNAGERKTTNAGFRYFKEHFDWVIIIHADDIVKKDWLTTLINQTEQVDYGTCFTVWSSFDTLFDASNSITPGDDSGIVQAVHKGHDKVRYYLVKITSNWHISGAALNAELYNRLQGFDEAMPQFGDTDFFVRGLMAGYTDVYIGRTLTLYRMSEGTVTSTSFRTNRDIKEVYMLISKFSHVLSKKDILHMYRSIQKMSGRRTIKWLARKELKLAAMNFKQFCKSLADATLLYFNRAPAHGKKESSN